MVQTRDLTVVSLPNEQCLVTAVDISASIGEKEHDVLSVPPELTGKLTTRVALLEVLASGAEVVAISNVVGVEMNPTGKRIIRGIQEELHSAGLAHLELNGSTEENMTTSQTSVGVFVTGYSPRQQLKLNNIKNGATLLGIGEPRMGQALLEKPNLEVSYQLVRELVKSQDILELVPVGSKGIRYEASNLADLNGYHFNEFAKCNPEWLDQSAGPATALIIAVQNESVTAFVKKYPEAYLLGIIE
ncbi:AIR synthase related protein [Bacillus massiliigorillae]|uniref:AIR synthase related protein n=1 Tax=Bacillus massiliigorillae TaxID=1243664 RepID=UPI0003A3E147|nr:AIR synthase related protein [Bacillus massiliigorillae]